MKKTLISSFYYIFFDLAMESGQSPSLYRVHLTLIFYFSQTLSPLFKLHYGEFSDILSRIFPYLFFYSSFTNILSYLKNSNLFLLLYIIAFMIILYPLFYILIATLFRYYLKIMALEKSKARHICVLIFRYFNTILLIPIIDILSNPLDCDWYVYSKFCYESNTFFIISSIFTLTCGILLGGLLAYSNKNYKFLSRKTEFEWNFIRFIIFMLRNMQSVLFLLLKKMQFFIYISENIIGLLSFIEYFYYGSLRNKVAYENYIKYLCIFEGVIILMVFWNYIGLIDNSNIFYFLILMFVLAFKLGTKLSELKFNRRFMLKPFDIDNFDEVLEEIRIATEFITKKPDLKVLGYIKNHIKSHCSDPICCEQLILFNNDSKKFIAYREFTNAFIINKFTYYINNKDIKIKEDKKTELILKYIDFLKAYSNNPKKLLFDFERMKQKILNNSYFIKQLLAKLNTTIKESIFYDNELLSDKQREKSLMIEEFFKMNKYKIIFINLIKDIMKAKKRFWSDYIIGYHKMDKFVDAIQSLGGKINNFQQFIQIHLVDPACKVIAIKAFSLHYSIFLNEISMALHYEEEYNNIFKNELIFKQNDKNKLSFIEQNIVTCEASFLNYDGIIKSSSKSSKLAKLFGYTKGEAQMINSIEDLMPPYIKLIHKDFVKNYINKPKLSLNNYPITTYALHKDNYVVPVCTYNSLRYATDDFVIVAAILYDEMNDDLQIIYNIKGEIIGISKKMLFYLTNTVKEFRIERFQNNNIYDAIYELKHLSENHNNNEFILNQHSILSINFYNDDNTNTSQTIQKRKSKSLHSISKKCTKFDIDFDLKIHKHFYTTKDQISIFNMSIKNITYVPEEPSSCIDFNRKNANIDVQMNQEENIQDSFNQGTLRRDDPKSLMIQDKKAFVLTEIPIPINIVDIKKHDDMKSYDKVKSLNKNNEIVDGDKNKELTNSIDFHSSKRGKNEFEEQKGAASGSSVLKVNTVNFKVFAGIQNIKEFVPKSFYLFFLGIFLEIILMFSFSVLAYNSMDNYFQNAFYPNQKGIIRFCSQYSAFALGSCLTTELEYQYLYLFNNTPSTNYNEFYYRILQRNFLIAKNIVYSERDSPQILQYQNIYENEKSTLINIDSIPKRKELVSYFELIDYTLNYMNDLMNQQNFRNVNYDYLIWMQREYPSFLVPSALVFSEIKGSFLSYSVDISNSLMVYMIIFLMIMICLKIFEIIQIAYLYYIVNRLASIFLRCNPNEALQEIRFIDNLLDHLDKSEDFIYMNFSEKLLMKKKELAFFDQGNLNYTINTGGKSAKKKKPTYIHSNLNLASMKKNKGFFFIFLTVALSFGFYFLNYYYWTTFTSTVQEVISLDTSFSSLYVYAASVLATNNLYIRELILSTPSYEYINDTYQKPSGRMTYFLAALNKRLVTVRDIFNNEMPSGIINAKGTVKDPNFNKLIDGNLCEVLLSFNKIEIDEEILCKNIWEQSFQKGIMMATNQYIQQIVLLSNLRSSISNKTTSTAQKLIQNATIYINDPKHQDLFLGVYYLCEALLLFYDYINEFYNPIIENERYSTKSTLIVTMTCLMIISSVALCLIWKYMKNFYKFLALSLSLMPYEKITEDEATVQIIKNFIKKMS